MTDDLERTFTLHFTESLIRRATWAYWRRVVGWRFVVVIAVILGSFISSVASGDRSWWVGVSATFVLMGIAFAIAIYVIQFRGSIKRFRRMKSPEATFAASEDRFRVSSDVGSSEMSWSTITEIWRFTDFWLIFFSPSQFITLPLADLDPEARELILGRAKSFGSKIK